METKKVKFVLNADVLKSNVQHFSEIGQVYYPLKTNSNPIVLEELIELFKDNNNGFLITHRSHFEKLIKLGVTPNRMGLVNVLASDEDIKYYYESGVRYFTFDSLDKLLTFFKYANASEVKISVRLNIKEPFNIESHLGTTTSECKEMFDMLRDKRVPDYGVSFYLQKELFPQVNVLNEMLDYIIRNFSSYNLDFINIGGALKSQEIDRKKLDEAKEALGAKYIILEPGRYMVGNSGYMLNKIIRRKSDDCFVVQNGIYGGLVDTLLYHKQYQMFLLCDKNLVRLSTVPFEGGKSFKLCGSSSDSGDRLGTFYIDEKYYSYLFEGNDIIILDALSYVEEFFMSLGGDLEPDYHVVNCNSIEKRR